MAIVLFTLVISVLLFHAAWAEPFARGWVLVKFKPGTPASSVAAAHRLCGSRVIDDIPQLGVQRVTAPRGREIDHAARYTRNPNVQFAEPDYTAQAMETIPNDPWFTNWQSGFKAIQAPAAWDISTGSENVIIAIVDTGVDASHPDLVGRVMNGYDFYCNDTDATDENHHGTHIAGIIGAVTNNGIGIAGITWKNPILPVKVYDAIGTSPHSIIAKGIIYATDRGAKVINLSLGGSDSSTMKSAIDYAYNRGVVLAAATGNSGTLGISYPAAYPNVIAVGASDGWDQRSYISNYGNELDVLAPDVTTSTCLLGRYETLGGTSMSTAYISAVCGLVLSVNPSLKPADVMRIVRESADDIAPAGWDMYSGCGRLNAYKALEMAAGSSGTPVPPPSITDVTAPSVSLTSPSAETIVSGTVSLCASASDNIGVTRVDFLADGELVASASNYPYTASWNSSQSSSGQIQLTAKAFDAAGNSAVSVPKFITVSNPTSVNYSFTGSIGVRGIKYHSFTLQNPATVSTSLSWSRANLDLYLLDSEGQEVASSCTSNIPETISTAVLPAGNYTLKVISISGKVRYKLNLTCTSQ